MHFLGFEGMPRWIYTYPADRGWDHLNLVVSIGGLIQGVAVLIFAYNLIRHSSKAKSPAMIPGMRGRSNGLLPLPRRLYNFATDPVVHSRRPLWDLKHPEDPDWKYE